MFLLTVQELLAEIFVLLEALVARFEVRGIHGSLLLGGVDAIKRVI